MLLGRVVWGITRWIMMAFGTQFSIALFFCRRLHQRRSRHCAPTDPNPHHSGRAAESEVDRMNETRPLLLDLYARYPQSAPVRLCQAALSK